MSTRVTGVLWWTLLACGAGVLLYLVYAPLFTSVTADRAQHVLRTQCDRHVDRLFVANPVPG